jgi:hypothetical protein
MLNTRAHIIFGNQIQLIDPNSSHRRRAATRSAAALAPCLLDDGTAGTGIRSRRRWIDAPAMDLETGETRSAAALARGWHFDLGEQHFGTGEGGGDAGADGGEALPPVVRHPLAVDVPLLQVGGRCSDERRCWIWARRVSIWGNCTGSPLSQFGDLAGERRTSECPGPVLLTQAILSVTAGGRTGYPRRF